MARHGVDVEQARASVMQETRGYFAGRYRHGDRDAVEELHDILGDSNADGILAARDEVVLTLLEELYWMVDEPHSLTVMVTGSPLETGAAAAVTVSQARQYCDRLLVQAFHQDTRAVYDSVSSIAVLRGSTPVQAGIAAYAPYVRSADDLLEKARAARDSGADGLQFYHYGLMPLENLGWIRAALSNL